jgi:hypothetical protein
LCGVSLGLAATLACGDLVPTVPPMGSGGSGSGVTGSSGSNSNPDPGTSGSGTSASAGSDSSTNGGSGGSDTPDAGGGASGNAGSSSSGAAGVSGSASGAAGSTSGASGGAGAPASDPCTHTGPRTKTDLTPTNGRVECTTNDFGIEGDWKLNSSDPQLMTTNFTGSMVCGSGTIAQVIPTATSNGAPDFGRYWGGGLAFIMYNGSAGAPALPYNATANGLTGISAKITANTGTIPAQMRFKFKMIGSNDSYCKEVDGATSGQTIVLHTGDAVHDCWAPDNASTLDVTMIENYEVQVVSQTSMAVPFDFCLTEITALTN